jgi:uncharacterized protein (TIGR03437 family)
MKKLFSAALFLAISSLPLAAQAPTFDTSGNHLLTGTYYFRHALYGISTSADSNGFAGDISEAVIVYGNITFDGNGNFSITAAQVADSSNTSSTGAPVTDPLSCYLASTNCAAGSGTAVAGTYAISASGFGYLSSPVVSGDFVYGLVAANGVFSGSTTETSSSYSDMFVATPLGSPQQSNATFQGSYTVSGFFPGGSPLNSENAFFQLNADGNGNLGTVNVTGYYGNGGTTQISQSNTGIKYSFLNGAAVVTFPVNTNANFFSGPVYLYFSPDGNFFVGGTPNGGYDMLVGVRNGSGTQNFSGLYYEAGLDQDLSQLQSAGYANFDGYYGAFDTLSTGQIVAHDRINSVFNATGLGSTFQDSVTLPVTGTYTDTTASFQYAVGANGTIRVGAGIWPALGITMAMKAPTFTPTSSVYINPTGIVNAASFAPFTAGVSNGEFLAIYGTNLAPSTMVASSVPYPTTLNGVQVLINGAPAPIYYVTSGQLAVIVPGANPYILANIQVINNGTLSNTVTVPVNKTTPGVYTIPSGGLGSAAAVHTNGQIVTASNPAAPGESIELFATGLGSAYPTVADGAAPPISPLSYTTNTITADIGGTSASVLFAGLAPTLAGLYQINLTVPTTLTAGTYTMDLGGPDSYTSESSIAVGTASGASTSARPAAALRQHALSSREEVARKAAQRPAFCTFRAGQSCAAPKLAPSPGSRF